MLLAPRHIWEFPPLPPHLILFAAHKILEEPSPNQRAFIKHVPSPDYYFRFNFSCCCHIGWPNVLLVGKS